MIMASEQRGMNIEEVAKENNDAIIWQSIDIMEGRTTVWVHVCMLNCICMNMGVCMCHDVAKCLDIYCKQLYVQ